MKKFFDRLARSLGGDRALNIINSSSDIILALFIIVLIMVIIIPVTPGILDNLIAINMTISIARPDGRTLHPQSGPPLDLPFASVDHDTLPLRD